MEVAPSAGSAGEGGGVGTKVQSLASTWRGGVVGFL